MSQLSCMHISQIREVTLSVEGCEDCLNTGDSWRAFASAESAGMWAAAIRQRTNTRRSTFRRRIIRLLNRSSRASSGAIATLTGFSWKEFSTRFCRLAADVEECI